MGGKIGTILKYAAGLVGGIVLWKFSMVGGTLILVITCGVGIYKYVKYRKDLKLLQSSKELQLTDQQLQNLILEIAIKNVEEWQKLQCTEEEMESISILTEELLKLKCQKYTCPITHFVTRDPVQLKCCKNFCQNVPIHTWVNQRKTCPTCRKSITQKDIETRESQLFERRDAIKMLRMQIRKTFMMLTEKTNKEQWKEKIENYMGIGYTKKSL